MGWGSRKKHRGAGERGGRGLAGLHKHRWPYALKYMPEHFGKRGFVRPPAVSRVVSAVNVGDLDQRLEEFLQKGLAKREAERIVIDVTKLGFEKVLGRGRVTRPFDVIAKEFSESAKRKLEEAGGKAIAG
jgi:large subunit ribosomal protein L15